MIEEFTRTTGIKVRYDTFDSNDTLETKLLAGKSGYDVVAPTAYFLERQIKAGVFQKLDKSKLPNLANLWPEITKRLAQYDPGNLYGVNYMWGTTGIGYNVRKVRDLLGPEAPIDSWDIVFKPENIAKFKDCGIHILDSSDDILAGALHYLGLDPNTTREGGLSEGRRPRAEHQAVRAQIPFQRIPEPACVGRNLLRGRLLRRREAGAEARGRGQERDRTRLRDPEGGRAVVVR